MFVAGSYIYNAENPQERIDALRAVQTNESFLLVAGGNPSDWPTIEPATYDYFVGIDRGCLHLLEADLPLQLAVGDFDSLSREEYHFVQETTETLIQAPAEKMIQIHN